MATTVLQARRQNSLCRDSDTESREDGALFRDFAIKQEVEWWNEKKNNRWQFVI